jgi:glycosyltransferase involved in cell wall biosynthesis
MSNINKNLAIIIPVYNEGRAIRQNFTEIYRIIKQDGISCKYLFIDDGSTDNTWNELVAITSEFEGTTAIRFSRNFGKEMALCAGLDSIDADRYIIMDSDLQHPPHLVKDMLELMDREQANIVQGIKANRGKESLVYKIAAKCFYKLLKITTGMDLNNSSDFKILDRKVADSIRCFNERNVFFRGLVGWVGFKTVPYYFEVDMRVNGASGFSFMKLMRLALNAVLSYTSKPLYLTIIAGIFFMVFAAVLGIQTLYNYFSGRAVSGFSTVILLLLFIGSAIMFSLGIIGVYISRIFDEIKGRPRYIVSERTKL